MPDPPRKVSWAAAACLVLAHPLAELAWLWLWGSLFLLCWSPGWALKSLAGGFLAMGLLPFLACLREGLRLLRILQTGQTRHLWLRECVAHPSRRGVWLGRFESAQGQFERLPLSHANWQPSQIYLFFSDPVLPEESVAWDDLPIRLRLKAQGQIGLQMGVQQMGVLLGLSSYLAVALVGSILVWGQIAR